jgi:hypothetical protein
MGPVPWHKQGEYLVDLSQEGRRSVIALNG